MSVSVPARGLLAAGKSAATLYWTCERGESPICVVPRTAPVSERSVAVTVSCVSPPLTKPTFERNDASERRPGMNESFANDVTGSIDWPYVPPLSVVMYVRLVTIGPEAVVHETCSAPLPEETPSDCATSAITTVRDGAIAMLCDAAPRLS